MKLKDALEYVEDDLNIYASREIEDEDDGYDIPEGIENDVVPEENAENPEVSQREFPK